VRARVSRETGRAVEMITCYEARYDGSLAAPSAVSARHTKLAEKSRMSGWRSIAPVQGQLCCSYTPRCHRTLLARSTDKAPKGWTTINALQFLKSEPWIDILTIRRHERRIEARERGSAVAPAPEEIGAR
jgi:hypothetical protein